MKCVRGFGKRYFTLASILAHAVMPKLEARASAFSPRLVMKTGEEESEEEEDPPPLELIKAPLCLQNTGPCHCNCYFKRQTRRAFYLARKVPKCTCNCRYFSFRRTGTHPPASFVVS